MNIETTAPALTLFPTPTPTPTLTKVQFCETIAEKLCLVVRFALYGCKGKNYTIPDKDIKEYIKALYEKFLSIASQSYNERETEDGNFKFISTLIILTSVYDIVGFIVKYAFVAYELNDPDFWQYVRTKAIDAYNCNASSNLSKIDGINIGTVYKYSYIDDAIFAAYSATIKTASMIKICWELKCARFFESLDSLSPLKYDAERARFMDIVKQFPEQDDLCGIIWKIFNVVSAFRDEEIRLNFQLDRVQSLITDENEDDENADADADADTDANTNTNTDAKNAELINFLNEIKIQKDERIGSLCKKRDLLNGQLEELRNNFKTIKEKYTQEEYWNPIVPNDLFSLLTLKFDLASVYASASASASTCEAISVV